MYSCSCRHMEAYKKSHKTLRRCHTHSSKDWCGHRAGRGSHTTQPRCHNHSFLKGFLKGLDWPQGWERDLPRCHNPHCSNSRKIHLSLTRPLVKTCMPQINSNNTCGAGLYKKVKYFNQKYNNNFFPFFLMFWSNLYKAIRHEKDISLFRAKLKVNFKPTQNKHFKCRD